MSNKVIAISGYTGSGKTTVSEHILKKRMDFIYFDFGYLFRPLTYYLFNVLKLTPEEIEEKVLNNSLKTIIKFSYRIKSNKVEIGVNNNFYSQEDLYTLDMNMNTVTVGTIIGDSLSEELEAIVNKLKQESNVLLNARRPVVAYKNLDYHIFLEADFNTRLARKMKMNNEDYNTTYAKLVERDIKEENSGFWEKYDFTETIDTSNLTKDEVLTKVLNIIDRKIKITYINNLTLILGSYNCNKNCPYCIAKNTKKFNSSDKIENLDSILDVLERNSVKLKRFVISGNGEPSMYDLDDLRKIRTSLINHKKLFDLIRVHSSGYIFNSKEKFDLFNSIELPLEFEVLRISLDSNVDKTVLGYESNYLDSSLFKNSKRVKCDIALTDYLDYVNLKCDLQTFLNNNPSIKKVRFKKLLVGDDDRTPQAEWVRKHSLDDNTIKNVIDSLGLVKKKDKYESLDGIIVYKPSGNYDNDIVINNGEIKDYKYNTYNVKELKKRYGD